MPFPALFMANPDLLNLEEVKVLGPKGVSLFFVTRESPNA